MSDNVSLIWPVNNINVYYNLNNCGGGQTFGQEYLTILPKLYPERKFKNALEWCSGPGFIGFSLFGKGICENLYLNDYCESAIEDCKDTIANNPMCKDKVHVIQSETIASITDVKFDLIVANPPHFDGTKNIPEKWKGGDYLRICVDKEWETHRMFFKYVRNIITSDCVIILQEGYLGNSLNVLTEIATQHGFKVTEIPCKRDLFYFLLVTP